MGGGGQPSQVSAPRDVRCGHCCSGIWHRFKSWEILFCHLPYSRQSDDSWCCGMLRSAAACFKTPMCSSKNRVLRHAAACCAWCTQLLAHKTLHCCAGHSLNWLCFQTSSNCKPWKVLNGTKCCHMGLAWDCRMSA